MPAIVFWSVILPAERCDPVAASRAEGFEGLSA
jgi:hypothetical protein